MTLEQFCKMVTLAPQTRRIPIINFYELVDGNLKRIAFFSPLTDLGPMVHGFDKYRNYEVVSFLASQTSLGVAVQAP